MTEAGDAWVEERSPSMGVVLVGILGLLLGLLGVCLLLFYVLGQVFQGGLSGAGQQNEILEMQQALQSDPLFRLVTIVSVVMNAAFGLVFIIGSIGLFGLRPWAWKLSVTCVVTFLIWSILLGIFSRVTLGPKQEEVMTAMFESREFQDLPEDKQRRSRFLVTKVPWIGMGCAGMAYLAFLGGLLIPGIRRQFSPPPREEPQAEA